LTRQGNQGPNVYALQYLLRFHGQILTLDGNFGPQTRSAVMNFQTNEGLAVDGLVGPQTWIALIHGGTVQPGSHGDPTRAVQYLLKIKFGYALAIDGIYGPETQSVITDFQQGHGLVQDGIVGGQSWKALIAIAP